MNLNKYTIVFIQDLERFKNFISLSKTISGLELLPASNTIDNFTYYSDIGIKVGYTTYDFCVSEEVVGWPGKLGCNISHQLMYDKFLQTDGDWCLVLEDDCFVKNYDEGKLRDIIMIADDNNSHFIQLYTNPGFVENQIKEKKYAENLYEMFPQWHTIAYLVSRTGIQRLKEEYPMEHNVDKFLSINIDKLNSLCWINDMFLNGGEVPDVKPTIVNGEEVWLRSGDDKVEFGSLIWHGDRL
jgi:hypothetical protein